ncbi:MAG: proline dehydrogenase family protein, partial [Gammaproteobacteria bacterium]|nr:proline dehydrogenase family protein [Gammaproteobacteria bacterium]
MRFTEQSAAQDPAIRHLDNAYLADETTLVKELAKAANPGDLVRDKICDTASSLVESVRANKSKEGGIDAFLQQYDLSSEEGVLLMCIAEALLRIPDADTADKLIADKVTSASWDEHLGESDSLFVNASTWGLMLTGQLLKFEDAANKNPLQMLGKLAGRAGEPVVRTAMRQAMRIMGHQFVMGRTIREALERAARKGNSAYRYSFDMLGEAALTADDAERYFTAYFDAIESIGEAARAGDGDIFSAPSISVKLSALHPRYTFLQHERVINELVPRVVELVEHANESGIALTIDAEEADRLELSLEVFAAAYRQARVDDYEGLGLAVQTYQRRASGVIDFIAELATKGARRIPVRLVKGA